MAEELKELPINITEFKCIRENNFLYVDKTPYIETLLDSSDRAFILLRPKSFGKTLFVSTLESFFRGEQDLFEGLYIHTKIRKFEKWPVLSLNMAVGSRTPEIMTQSITSRLMAAADEEGLQLRYQDNPGEALYWLIKDMHKKHGKQIVILVDSYEKAIVDHLFDAEAGLAAQKILRDFYTALRNQEPYIKFLFLCGMIKMTQSALTTFMSNITDLSFSDEFAAAYGYTREEFVANFSDRFEPLLKKNMASKKIPPDYTIVDLRNQILDYYDTYSWNGVNSVFSPYQINRFFYVGGPKDLWFKHDNPLLLEQLINDNFGSFITPVLNYCPYNDFGHTNVGKVNPLSLMFYSGYLTVDRVFNMNGKLYYNLKIQSHEKNYEFCETIYKNFYMHKTDTEMRRYMRIILFAIRSQNDRAAESLFRDHIFGLPAVRRHREICELSGACALPGELDMFPLGDGCGGVFDIQAKASDEKALARNNFLADEYLRFVHALNFGGDFNVLFQTALQAFFERHGFLTLPEILRTKRDLLIECISPSEVLVFKVAGVRRGAESEAALDRSMANAAKAGLDYLVGT
jgi:hypothetical protein